MENENRLIDANELLVEAVKAQALEPNTAVAKIIMLVTEAERVDAVEVVHGRWIKGRLMVSEGFWSGRGCEYTCSICGDGVPVDEEDNFSYIYCPTCGAKMDGERKDNGKR